jgi:hypothetical protein
LKHRRWLLVSLTALLLAAAGGWWLVRRAVLPQPERKPEPRFAIIDEDVRPILTAEQIVSYEWASHRITLQPGATLNVRVKEGHSIVHGVPFAVVADGVTCYRGAVTTSLSSFSQSVPVIDIDPFDEKENVVRIELGYPSWEYFKCKDPRGDERVRHALGALGKLRE